MDHRPARSRSRRAVVAASSLTAATLMVATLIAGCSSDPSVTADSVVGGATPDESTDDGSTDSSTADTSLPTPITVPITGVVTIPLDSIDPPADGIADIDASDDLCRGLARTAGTSTLISVAVSFGGFDPDTTLEEMWRVEVISSPLVLQAVATADGGVPPRALEEQPTLRSTFLDPRENRARIAVDALVEAGAQPDDLELLDAVWLEVLRTDDQLDPAIDVARLPERLEILVTRAVAAISGRLDPYVADRELSGIGSMPAIERHLSSKCPEVLGLIASDAV
jgi:hypothetical protein